MFPRTPEPEQVFAEPRRQGLPSLPLFHRRGPGRPRSEACFELRHADGRGDLSRAVAAGESRAVVFKMPMASIPSTRRKPNTWSRPISPRHFEKTVSFWENLVGQIAAVAIPRRQSAGNAAWPTPCSISWPSTRSASNYITNVNKFQYHDFYGGSDASHMRVAFDYMGLEEIARKTVLYSIAYQCPDGSFDRPDGSSPYYEILGCNLWCLGRHYQLTRDEAFLRQVYPTWSKPWSARCGHAQGPPAGPVSALHRHSRRRRAARRAPDGSQHLGPARDAARHRHGRGHGQGRRRPAIQGRSSSDSAPPSRSSWPCKPPRAAVGYRRPSRRPCSATTGTT